MVVDAPAVVNFMTPVYISIRVYALPAAFCDSSQLQIGDRHGVHQLTEADVTRTVCWINTLNMLGLGRASTESRGFVANSMLEVIVSNAIEDDESSYDVVDETIESAVTESKFDVKALCVCDLLAVLTFCI